MTVLRRLLGTCTLAGALLALWASAATAQTYYVNQRGEVGPCTAPGKHACLTIKEAIALAEKSPAPNTIEVEPGEGGTPYIEPIVLDKGGDSGLTINGDGEGVRVESKTGVALSLQTIGGAVKISNLSIVQEEATGVVKSAVADRAVPLTLESDYIENEAGGGVDGVEIHEAPLTIDGGEVSMESGTTGYAVYAYEAPLTIDGAKILSGSESEADAGGVYSEKSTLTLKATDIGVESGSSTTDFDIAAGKDSSVTIEDVNAKQSTGSLGVTLESSPATVNGLNLEMLDAKSNVSGVLTEDETAPTAPSTFTHMDIGGTWTGASFIAIGGAISVSDSRLIESASGKAGALAYLGAGSGMGLFVQRSVLEAAPSANEALEVIAGNATTDSSEILGGKDGVRFETGGTSSSTLTLSASTIDAGAPGIAEDAAGTNGVEAVAKGTAGNVANVKIQGSIVLEKQVASAATGDEASIACAYSAVPNQVQSAGGGTGAIACATGTSANSEVNPLSALFLELLYSSYRLSSISPALNSVPVSALSLPFGLTPSTTDLAGNPRSEDVACNLVQDKGALQLQGHSTPCPAPKAGPISSPAPIPSAPALTALSISPGAFFAAPSGPTVTPKAKRGSGAKIGYRDSETATTTFTILRPTSGRMRGKSCKKPSRANKRGKRCTLYVSVGGFTHADKAGANSLYFSGRIKGRKLAPGSYRLQAVPHNAARTGKAVEKSFKIK